MNSLRSLTRRVTPLVRRQLSVPAVAPRESVQQILNLYQDQSSVQKIIDLDRAGKNVKVGVRQSLSMFYLQDFSEFLNVPFLPTHRVASKKLNSVFQIAITKKTTLRKSCSPLIMLWKKRVQRWLTFWMPCVSPPTASKRNGWHCVSSRFLNLKACDSSWMLYRDR